jgi:hypothetical protein
MKRAKSTSVIDMSTGTLRCYRCGDYYVVNLPCPLTLVIAMLKCWDTMHRRCRQRANLLWVQHVQRLLHFLRACCA